MSLRVLATPLAFFFFFSGFVVAQISAPACNSTLNSTWEWSYNSRDQNPCVVAAYLMSTCNGSEYIIPPTIGNYTGPSTYDSNLMLCLCTAVAYSLISACSGCQGGTWITWSDFTSNCISNLFPVFFPYPVPGGTDVPYWAITPNVTIEGSWDFNKSYAAGGIPEVGPGTKIPVPSSPTPAHNPPPAPTEGNASNAGPIAGGIVGGIVAISLLIAALFFYRRRRRSRASSAARPAGNSLGDGQSAVVPFNSPILSQTPSRASSRRNLYIISTMPAPEPHD